MRRLVCGVQSLLPELVVVLVADCLVRGVMCVQSGRQRLVRGGVSEKQLARMAAMVRLLPLGLHAFLCQLCTLACTVLLPFC